MLKFIIILLNDFTTSIVDSFHIIISRKSEVVAHMGNWIFRYGYQKALCELWCTKNELLRTNKVISHYLLQLAEYQNYVYIICVK